MIVSDAPAASVKGVEVGDAPGENRNNASPPTVPAPRLDSVTSTRILESAGPPSAVATGTERSEAPPIIWGTIRTRFPSTPAQMVPSSTVIP